MKPKGISLIELHCEKIFLAVLALAALGVVAMQFTGEGNTVRVGSGGEYRLDQAYEQVASLAESKLGQLESNAPNQQAPTADPAFADQFIASLDSAPLSETRMALSRPHPPIGGDVIAPGSELRVAAVDPGVPSAPVTNVFLGTIEPRLDMQPAFEAIYGPGEWPRDVRAISVETSYDALGLRNRLQDDADGPGPIEPAPGGFWSNRHLIAGVYVERQERTDEGGWSAAELIESPPGALNTRELLGEAEQQGRVGDTLSLVKGDRGWEIVAPSFAPAPAGWWPPSFVERLENGEDADQLALELQARSERGANMRGVETESVWTHDYTVKPGATYRYRVRLAIPNPYFGFSLALHEDVRELAEAGFLYTDFSDWSDPVTAPRESYWFAFSATDGRGDAIVGEASCRLDVYGFVDGKWRLKQQRFEPGQPIRVSLAGEDGVERVVDTGARVVDVVRASLTEPGVRGGRQAPMQIVAASGEGLALREVWRDRASAERRELAEAIERPALPEAPVPAARERQPRPDRGGERREAERR